MKILFSVLMLTISVCSFAQNDKKWEFVPQSTLSIGASFQKFDGLNSRIANFSQYEQVRDHTGTLALGWLKERNQLVSDFGIMAGSSLSGDRDKKSSVIRFIGLGANIGYDVLKSEKLMLYPLAGIGYQWYQAKFYTDNSSVPFDAVLQSDATQNAIRAVSFKNGFFNYNVGLGFAAKSPKGGSIGLKATYTGSFNKQTWKGGDNQALANSPEDKLSQFNVGIVLGMQPMMMKH